MREEQHVTDTGSIRQKHHKAVNTDTAAASRGKTEFQRADVVGVVIHGFIIAVSLSIGLSLKAGGLVFRVIQFREAVSGFTTGDIKLKAFREFRISTDARARAKFRPGSPTIKVGSMSLDSATASNKAISKAPRPT